MDRIKGLKEYVSLPDFRQVLGIPAGAAVDLALLAQGEYNINYTFVHPATGKRLVLRINAGSQMHLGDQIGYEHNALKLLEPSGRTPKPLYVDGSRQHLGHGIMVMEFLEGRALDYRRDLERAAECLADIHSVPVAKEMRSERLFAASPQSVTTVSGLVMPEDPLQAILDECGEMVQAYYHSELGELSGKKQIERMLEEGRKKAELVKGYSGYRCCINTELNSGNFLINGKNRPDYLVDWEKPLYGDPVQDLGHFLAPTTTFWKTDVILTAAEMEAFVHQYEQATRGRFDTADLKERLDLYIPITCLRGITWCAMAWVQYQAPGKMIRNEEAFRKMESYLSEAFLKEIENRYF